MPYQVVSPPPPRGVVYSVTPVGQEGPLRQLHRTELRSVPEGRTEDGTFNCPTEYPPTDLNVNDSDKMVDSELIPEVDSDTKDDCVERLAEVQLLPNQDLTKETGTPLVAEPRRSVRKTAGQHSNPHKLPQSVQVTKPAA